MSYSRLNDIYITDRLAARLAEITSHSVATIIAPAGYGKTTAIRRWQKSTSSENIILSQTILNENTSDLWRRFCRLLSKHDSRLADQMMSAGFPQDIQGCGVMADLWEERKSLRSAIWWILDDVHLLPQGALNQLIMSIPDDLHLVLISRDRILTHSERLRLGRRLCEINTSDLALTEPEMRHYVSICGLNITTEDAVRMMQTSEGWIGLIYLFLRSKAQGGNWCFDAPDVFVLIDSVMLDPLTEQERDFLMCCCVAEEFTKEQAAFLWQNGNSDELLAELTEHNAFITVNEEGIYRFHNMLLQRVRARFEKSSHEEQKTLFERLGRWHFMQGSYLEAMQAFRKAEAWQLLLEAAIADRGNSLDGGQKNAILGWCASCPKEILRSNPEALLVLTLACFTVGAVPEMLRMNTLMLEATQNNPKLTREEQNNYLGESYILMSFLEFNSITGMSAYQRRAGEIMTRPTRCLDLNSPWTFGAPSVLSLYHREVGTLDTENADIKDCMPFYERISGGHGSGAEYIFEGETCLMRGDYDGAKIACFRAITDAEEKKQHSVLAAAAFLAVRLDLMDGNFHSLTARLEALRKKLKSDGQLFLLTTADMCEAWCYAILGRPDYAPEWVADSPAASLKGPAWPSFLTIRDQVRLSGGEYLRVIASGERRAALFNETHAMLPSVYLHIQMAASYVSINRRENALREIRTAINLAEPDKLFLPFAENWPYIHDLLSEIKLSGKSRASILAIANRFMKSREIILKKYFPPQWDSELTEREKEIAGLAALRLSTIELAEKLHLSENTVKTHLRHIYEKLGITGTDRNKRSLLAHIAGEIIP